MKRLVARLRFWFRRFYRVRVTFSLDRTLYYVDRAALKHRKWLGVAQRPMDEAPADRSKSTDGWFGAGVTIKKADGQEYWRDVRGFPFYSVRASERRLVRADDDLVLDYEGLPR